MSDRCYAALNSIVSFQYSPMEGYIVSLVIFTAVFALFSLGLNLQWGFTGLINFGHVAFMTVGSYLVVMLTTQGYLNEIPVRMLENFTWMQDTPLSQFLPALGNLLPARLPIWLALVLGAATAALLGLLVGLATLRLREDYLAIVTIGIAEMLRLVALNEQWLTQGTFGIQTFPLPLSQLQPNAPGRILMIAVVTTIVGLGLWRLWRWTRRQTKGVPLAALMRSVVGLLGYLLSLAGVLASVILLIQIVDRTAAASGVPFPDWALTLVLLGLVGLVSWLYVVLAHRALSRLPAITEATALTAAVLIAGLGLWVYGYGASALYNYARNPTKTGLMWLSVVMVALVYAVLQRLVNSPWGRVLKAIREDEQVARALGKNAFWYKLQSLMLGGAIAGLAGALYAWQLTTVYPDNFRPLETFNAWTIVVLGGAGSNAGTLLGAAIFWTYQTATRFALEDIIPLSSAQLGAFRIMVIGLLLMVLMIWRPQGILGRAEELTLDR